MVLKDSKPKRPQSGRMQKAIVPELVTFKTFVIQKLVKAGVHKRSAQIKVANSSNKMKERRQI